MYVALQETSLSRKVLQSSRLRGEHSVSIASKDVPRVRNVGSMLKKRGPRICSLHKYNSPDEGRSDFSDLKSRREGSIKADMRHSKYVTRSRNRAKSSFEGAR